MPLTNIKKLKLIATGNLHEETNREILPEFLHNYTVESEQDLYRRYGGEEEWSRIQAKNYIFCPSEDECELFISSCAHILLIWDDKKNRFVFNAFLKNNNTADSSEVHEETNLKKEFLSNKNKEEINPGWINDKRIKGVFSSQFGGCSFQMAIIGGTVGTPKYLLFSHLQGKSPLKNIVEEYLKLNLSDVHICINQCFPDTEAINRCYHGFINNVLMQKNTITLIRDKYFWLPNQGGGYSLSYSGYCINGNKLQAQYLVGQGTGLFLKACIHDLQIHNFPLFNTLTEEQKNIIKAVSSESDKSQALDVYFELFKQGKLGDYYSIKQEYPDSIYYETNKTEELLRKQKSIKEAFIECYNFESFSNNKLNKLNKLIKPPEIQKFISWEKEWNISELISCVLKFEPKVKPGEIFIDLSVGKYIE